MTTNLALQLRQGTTKAHSMAENVSFVKSFLGGVVDKQAYRQLIANFYFVYSAIEDEMKRHQESQIIKPIYFEELNRKSSLEEDLQFYYGLEWQDKIFPSPATKVYINRIHEISNTSPELLIAHCYTRYLGDLSGGQILKKITQSAMNLSGGEGTAFYEFKDIKDEKNFKQNYRLALDSIHLSDSAIKSIVSEANIAFKLNMKIFQELNSNFIKIIAIFLFNFIKRIKLPGFKS
uniref:heme oxygenase n=1 Tax=Rhodella violacea TaxID=2801 RepID=UPI001FCDC40E|nr:heme oxygenase [Rhodella violacea]UNJ18132.1 heme oxygenase [Rhodella violacea]